MFDRRTLYFFWQESAYTELPQTTCCYPKQCRVPSIALCRMQLQTFFGYILCVLKLVLIILLPQNYGVITPVLLPLYLMRCSMLVLNTWKLMFTLFVRKYRQNFLMLASFPQKTKLQISSPNHCLNLCLLVFVKSCALDCSRGSEGEYYNIYNTCIFACFQLEFSR